MISLSDKKIIRYILLFVLIQALIICVFIFLISDNQPININETKLVDVIVDDIYCFRVRGENWLCLVADSTKYLFFSRATFADYSVHELYTSISKGDRLSLRYYESNSGLLKISKISNIVVDARSETEIYRTLEEYNRGIQGGTIGLIIIFLVVELIFVGVFVLYIWWNYKTIKKLLFKMRIKAQRK